MSKPSINDPDLARKFGYKNAFEFWANYSGQATGTLYDHANYALGKNGYTGTIDDKFNAFLHDCFGSTTQRTPTDCFNSLAKYPLSNLTFFKNYATLPTGTVTNTQLNANLSKGVGTATFTATRSATAPATYVDDNGVIQLVTTSDVGRIRGGYYDATGFHAQKGLMIEGSGTNLIIRTDGTASGSGLWTGWTIGGNKTETPTFSQVLVPELCSISSAASQRIQYTGGAGDDGTKYIYLTATRTGAGTVVNNNIVTVSGWVRSQTGNTGVSFNCVLDVYTAANAYSSTKTGSALISQVSSTWTKFSSSITVNDAVADRVSMSLKIGDLSNGDTADMEFYGVQVEVSPYATSFIPTTTAALTRNAETLKYAIAGNRTAATESMFLRWCPIASPTKSGGRVLMDTDTKQRFIEESAGGNRHVFFPNVTDSPGCIVGGNNNLSVGTAYTYANICTTSGSTHAYFYIDGSLSSNNPTDTDNYTANAWGTYWYLGSSNGGTNQQNACFGKIAFYSDAKGATDVASITNLLNQ